MTTSSLPPSRRGRRLGAALVAAAVSVLGISIVVAPPASATTINVTSNLDSGTGTLREAIAKAGDGDHPDADTITFGDIGGPIHLVTPLEIDSNLTIVGSGNSVDGDGVTQLFVVPVGVTATIGQVHMYEGNTTGNGGAITVAGTLTLDRDDIHDNVAADGGAIYVAGGGSVTLTKSDPDDSMSMDVHDNDATASGGGIYMSGGTLTITDSAFTSNTSGATAASEGGGAISALGASVSILRTSFSNNETTGDGGALFGDGSGTQIASSTFDSNSSSRFGGAVALVGATLSLKGSRLAGNFAMSGGGALRTYDVAATVAGSVVRNNNVPAGDGGGIEVFTDDSEGSLEVEASTIVGNSQTGSQVHGTSIRSVRMADTIVAVAGTGEDFDVSATTFDVHHSLIQDPSAGSTAALTGHANVLGASPQLSFSDGSPRPSSSSPAVDAGDPSFLTTTLDLTTDIRGLPRVSGDAIDMGAVELQHASTPTVDLQSDYDTGSSQTDNVTRDPSPVFDITGVAGLTVELHRGDDTVGFRTGNGTVPDPDDVEGEFAYTALAYGEVGDPVSSAPLTVTRDHTAPAAPGVPDLDASSDLGTSATDDLTSATTRTFNLSGVESTATVQLSQWTAGPCVPIFIGICFPSPDIHTAVGDPRVGNGSVTESSQPGTATPAYEARQTDLAGNPSGYSSRRIVTFDFVAPSIPNAPDLQAASDDGTSTTDNSTTKTALTFDVTGVDSGATATLARVDGESGDEVDTRTGNGAMTDAGPVSTGTHTYVVAVMDAAGNTSVDRDGLDVTVVAPAVAVVPPSTTPATPPTTTPPTTVAPSAPTTPAKASDSTPNAGDTIKLDTPPSSGGSTSSTLDSTKPSTAVLLSTSGGADLPMPQPVITKNADGSLSISVHVPADTPPGVYLIAVMGTTPSGQSRVIIVPVVVRRIGAAARVRGTSVLASAAAVPTVARSIQASVAALGGPAVVEQAVRGGATLSIAGDRLIVDHHAAPGTNRAGLVGVVGLVLAALVLFRRSTRRLRSIR